MAPQTDDVKVSLLRVGGRIRDLPEVSVEKPASDAVDGSSTGT